MYRKEVIGDATLYCGDCLEVMRDMEENSVDAIVTDPPYALVGNSRNGSSQPGDMNTPFGRSGPSKKRGFMGKEWDGELPSTDIWMEALRVAKPGAHLLAAGAPRTHHRLMCALEDAGWEIRDVIMHCFSVGFPKSLDVSKQLDKMAGANRTEVIGKYQPPGMKKPWNLTQAKDEREVEIFASSRNNLDITAPVSDAAKQWKGYGTNLKPAYEPWILCRKPLIGTVVENVLRYGVGCINIDGCRIPIDSSLDDHRLGGKGTFKTSKMAKNVYEGGYAGNDISTSPLGRFPSDFIHDGSDEVVSLFPVVKGATSRTDTVSKNEYFNSGGNAGVIYTDTGSAARFFYCSKASTSDRDGSTHPTVKSTTLMKYLCRLVTPPNGIIFDPFAGSGSTGKAALLEGFRFIGIEREEEYIETAKRRIESAQKQAQLAL